MKKVIFCATDYSSQIVLSIRYKIICTIGMEIGQAEPDLDKLGLAYYGNLRPEHRPKPISRHFF